MHFDAASVGWAFSGSQKPPVGLEGVIAACVGLRQVVELNTNLHFVHVHSHEGCVWNDVVDHHAEEAALDCDLAPHKTLEKPWYDADGGVSK